MVLCILSLLRQLLSERPWFYLLHGDGRVAVSDRMAVTLSFLDTTTELATIPDQPTETLRPTHISTPTLGVRMSSSFSDHAAPWCSLELGPLRQVEANSRKSSRSGCSPVLECLLKPCALGPSCGPLSCATESLHVVAGPPSHPPFPTCTSLSPSCCVLTNDSPVTSHGFVWLLICTVDHGLDGFLKRKKKRFIYFCM